MSGTLKIATPVRYDDGFVVDANGQDIANVNIQARREDVGSAIVACVNACTDIPNPAAIADVVEALRAQEDAEFKNANCKECHGEFDWTECHICANAMGNAIDMRRAALDKLDEKP